MWSYPVVLTELNIDGGLGWPGAVEPLGIQDFAS